MTPTRALTPVELRGLLGEVSPVDDLAGFVARLTTLRADPDLAARTIEADRRGDLGAVTLRIVRGRGTASAAELRALHTALAAAWPAPRPDQARHLALVDALRALAELHESGAISRAEHQQRLRALDLLSP